MTLIVFSLRPSFRANPMLCAAFDNTARLSADLSADMFCIDRACLPSLIVPYRVSAAGSARRRNAAGRGGKRPVGEQLLGAFEKIHFIMSAYCY